jgi:hypothetical protein
MATSGFFRDCGPPTLIKVTVDRLVQTETDIARAYTIHGTHHGEFAGIAPAGRPITARGMQTARFEDGKIVERWGSSDELGILLKLGAKVSPGLRRRWVGAFGRLRRRNAAP